MTKTTLATLLLLVAVCSAVETTPNENWKLDGVLDIVRSDKSTAFKRGNIALKEINFQDYTLYQDTNPVLNFEFSQTFNITHFDHPDKHSKYEPLQQHLKAFSPDLTRLAVADGIRVRLYSLTERKLLHEWSFLSECDAATSIGWHGMRLDYSPDGKTLAVWVAYPRMLYVLDTETGAFLTKKKFSENVVNNSSFSPNSRSMFYAYHYSFARFDVPSGEEKQTIPFPTVNAGVRLSCIAESPGHMAVCPDGNTKIHIVNLANPNEQREVWNVWKGSPNPQPADPANDAKPTALAREGRFQGFSTNGRHFFTYGVALHPWDNVTETVFIHDTLTGKVLLTIPVVPKFNDKDLHCHGQPSVAVQNDRCFIANQAGDVRIYDLSTGKVIDEFCVKTWCKLPEVPKFDVKYVDSRPTHFGTLLVSRNGDRIILSGQMNSEMARYYILTNVRK